MTENDNVLKVLDSNFCRGSVT